MLRNAQHDKDKLTILSAFSRHKDPRRSFAIKNMAQDDGREKALRMTSL